MDFDWSWLLLGLPLAFVLGWLASRMDWRQMRIMQRSSPRPYFQGLTYLLNEQQDKAIDVFVEAVQSDPDTVELHFALGSLFRRRGEYDRAVRVHEHLLARADLSAADRARAQWDLAQDFLKAGLLDRAEAALQALEGTQLQQQAQTALLYIYERTHDWPQAQALAARMVDVPAGLKANGRQVHYWCEQADEAMRRKDFETASRLLMQATAQVEGSVRPWIEQVKLLRQRGQSREAIELALQVGAGTPDAVPLLAGLLDDAFAKLDPHAMPLLQQWHDLLRTHYEAHGSLDVLLALVAMEQHMGLPRADHWYVAHLRKHPSLVASAKLTQLLHRGDAAIEANLAKAVRPLLRYRCQQCGFETGSYFWQCPGCQSWESFPPRRVEEL